MMEHTCNPDLEAKQDKFKASQGYIGRPGLKSKQKCTTTMNAKKRQKEEN